MAQVNSDTLLRQWQMLRMIPRYPLKITAKALHEKLLAEQFEVTKRTIERDLLSLSEMFPLLSDERDKPYGWSWSKDAPVFDLPGLSHNEALTLAMVEQHLSTLLPTSTLNQLQPYFKAAKQHLSNIPNNEHTRSWLNKVRTIPPTQPLLPPKTNKTVQQTIYAALLADKQLNIKYKKRGEQHLIDYRIHPLAIVQRGAISYMCCTFSDYEEIRILPIHRIQSAIVLDDASKTPNGFSIDDEIASGKFGFGEGKQIKLEALFFQGAGEHLFETAISNDQILEELSDEVIKLTATVADTPQLRWWLMGFGAGVEIISPDSLRKMMIKTIGEMQIIYQ